MAGKGDPYSRSGSNKCRKLEGKDRVGVHLCVYKLIIALICLSLAPDHHSLSYLQTY